jgi:hypothetical protein
MATKTSKLKKYVAGGIPDKEKTKEYSYDKNYIKKTKNGNEKIRRTVKGFIVGAPSPTKIKQVSEYGKEAGSLFKKKIGGTIGKSKKK